MFTWVRRSLCSGVSFAPNYGCAVLARSLMADLAQKSELFIALKSFENTKNQKSEIKSPIFFMKIRAQMLFTKAETSNPPPSNL